MCVAACYDIPKPHQNALTFNKLAGEHFCCKVSVHIRVSNALSGSTVGNQRIDEGQSASQPRCVVLIARFDLLTAPPERRLQGCLDLKERQKKKAARFQSAGKCLQIDLREPVPAHEGVNHAGCPCRDFGEGFCGRY